MKFKHTALLFLVFCFDFNNWASNAQANLFEQIQEEKVDEQYKESAFVNNAKELPQITKFQRPAAKKAIAMVENLREKVEDKDMSSLEHLIAKHNEEKRLQIENLMKRGNILDPGHVGDGEAPTCYSCYGSTLKGCLSTKKEKQCQAAQRCYTVHLVTRATGQNTFVRGCINIATCESDICRTIHNTSKGQFSSCKAQCCKGKLCNGEDASTTPRPTGSATPPINGPKCYSCQGTDIASCASRMKLKQCLPGYQCADAYLVTKSNGGNLVAKGCIPSKLCGGGLCKKLNSTGRYSQCRSTCCKDSLCNALPTLPTTKGTTNEPSATPEPTPEPEPTRLPTPRTLPPRPTPKPGYKCYHCNSQTASQCHSGLKVRTCNLGQVCYTGQATQNNGIKMFAKGCMNLEQCANSCKRLSVTTKECKVDCCQGDYCNDFPLPTERPTPRPDAGCYRLVTQVLEVFTKTLETIDNLTKAKGLKEVAPSYKNEINSLMGSIDTHAAQLRRKDGPEAKRAATKVRSLRKRAGKVLKKLNKIIDRR